MEAGMTADFLNSAKKVAPSPSLLSQQTIPSMASTFFLIIERPDLVEFSPAVGLVRSY
ncbi:MAG: hypothetical protein ACOCYF_00805 [Bacteroidota bacterium]